jgi:DNA-binding CsgD family transcriptional regulator
MDRDVVMPHHPDAKLLDGVVPSPMLDNYAALLDLGSCPAEQAAELLGGDRAVHDLTQAGLAHLRPDGRGTVHLVPAPPDLALSGYLADFTRRALQGFQTLKERRPTHDELTRANLVRVLTDHDEIVHVAAAMINLAVHDWQRLDDGITDTPSGPGCAALRPPNPDVRRRTIYSDTYARTPSGAAAINTAVAAGEDARLLTVTMKLKLADDTEALLPLTPTGTGGALLVRSPVICAALRQYFDLLWERAIPYNATRKDSPLPSEQQAILNLLAQGLSDSAVARRLDISVPTVRRHITALRDKLGAETRWAAGAAAIRQGWID